MTETVYISFVKFAATKEITISTFNNVRSVKNWYNTLIVSASPDYKLLHKLYIEYIVFLPSLPLMSLQAFTFSNSFLPHFNEVHDLRPFTSKQKLSSFNLLFISTCYVSNSTHFFNACCGVTHPKQYFIPLLVPLCPLLRHEPNFMIPIHR